MRYSIMLQLVTTITAIFVAAAALFAWIQNRQLDTSGEVGKTPAIENLVDQ